MAQSVGKRDAERVLGVFRGLTRDCVNRHVASWSAEGRPVVGYFCHYVPSELIRAVGALPLRLRGAGSEDSSLGDAYLSGRICTYVRHVMSLVLDGRLAVLDGAIASNSCDHVRRAADVLRAKTAIRYHGFLSVPRSPRESLLGYYVRELRKLFGEMADAFGGAATDEALRAAIREANASRDRLRRLGELRLGDRPLLSGAESLTVHIASQILPPAVFQELADELLDALRRREPLPEGRARLVLVGAELDEPDFVEAIESQGAWVVADRLCFGARSVLPPIDEDAADPLEAIARAYFFRPSCARMIGDFPRRFAATRDLMAEARADGVVFVRLLFCDPWGADQHVVVGRAKGAEGFPLLTLSREYGIVPTGQVKTRIQAFVERLELARARGAAPEGTA